MKKILAVDMATKTGWAIGDRTGVEEFKKRTTESRGMIFLRFETWLLEMIDNHAPTMIVYERPHARGRAANEVLNGLLGILCKVCAQRPGVEYTDCPSTTLKKFATGKGNAGKDEMMAAYRQKWDKEPQDDNECDARWLHAWAVSEFS